MAEPKSHQKDLRRHNSKVQDRIGAAEKLLSRRTAEQRTQYAQQDGHGEASPAAASRAHRAAPRSGPAQAAPNARAGQAVSFAY